MIVHFSLSQLSANRDFKVVSDVVGVIHKTGNALARDWAVSQYQVDTKIAKELEPKVVYDLNMDAIERADVVIVESSVKSFGAGFQVAVALQKKKPTLLLIAHESLAEESRIAQGIYDPLFVRGVYSNEFELQTIVTNFIQENTYKTKDLRFNFVLDPQLYNHIRWKSFKSKKTKAEIVRELLVRDMNQN
jgi:hypothetical protein